MAEYIFGCLSQYAIHTAILTDYGLRLIDHALYTGLIRANNSLDMVNWYNLTEEALSTPDFDLPSSYNKNTFYPSYPILAVFSTLAAF